VVRLISSRLGRVGTDFYQHHDRARYVGTLGEIHELDDINQAIEMLGDLFDVPVVSVGRQRES
jgi:hypothetical protein